MKKYNSIENIREKSKFFLDPDVSVTDSVIGSLVKTALSDGALRISIKKLKNDLCVINFDKYWILENKTGDRFFFDTLQPLGGVPNTFRAEAILTAFSEYYFLFKNNIVIYASSDNFLYSEYIDDSDICDHFSILFKAIKSGNF